MTKPAALIIGDCRYIGSNVRVAQYRKAGLHIFNLSNGRPTSVLELMSAFERICGINIPKRFSNRRTGDVTSSHSNTNSLRANLNGKHQRTLIDMFQSSWKQFENTSVV